MTDKQHTGPVIPEGSGRAYEEATVSPLLVLRAAPSGRTQDNSEFMRFTEYELSISRHTGTSLVVTLRKVFNGRETVQQRKEQGYAHEAEVYTTTLSFAELANRLLGDGCYCCHDDEAFPESVKAAMRKAYPAENAQ